MAGERMSVEDFRRWRSRLVHARRIWSRKGLVGSEHPSDMRLALEMYRGNQWGHMGNIWGLDDHELVTVNKIFSTANTLQAQLSARNPQVSVFPRRPAGIPSAPKVTDLLNYDIEEQNMMRQWNLALRDHLFVPFGLVRHGFTPHDEFFDKDGNLLVSYRPAHPDRPWIKATRVWDALLDPTADSFHNDGDLKWVAFRTLMTVEQIKRTEGMIPRSGLAPNIGNPHRRLRPDDLLDDENEDISDLVEVYTVYEIKERTWFQMTIDSLEKPLRNPDDWPIQWEHLPVDILGINEQMDDPFPVSLLQEVIPIQVELNKIHSIMGILAKNIRRIIVATEGAMADDDLDKLEEGALMEILRTNGPAREAIAEIGAGGFPQDILAYRAVLEENIRELLGQSQMDRAQRINVETATEAQNVQQGSNIHALRNQGAFEKFMESSIRNYMQARRQTMQEEELVPILGREGAAKTNEPFLTVSRQDLAADFDYKIVAGSTLPRSRQADADKALADIQVAGTRPEIHNLRQAYIEYYIARGLDPDKYILPEQQQPPQQPQIPGEEPERGNIDPAAFTAVGEGQVQ
jgi:hypothetical protein